MHAPPGSFDNEASRYKFCCWIFHVQTGARIVYLLSLFTFLFSLYSIIWEQGVSVLSIAMLVLKLFDIGFFLVATLKQSEHFLKACLLIWVARLFYFLTYFVYRMIKEFPEKEKTGFNVPVFVLAIIIVFAFNFWIIHILYKYHRYLKEKNAAAPIFNQEENLIPA